MQTTAFHAKEALFCGNVDRRRLGVERLIRAKKGGCVKGVHEKQKCRRPFKAAGIFIGDRIIKREVVIPE
jgi:hypothetical protein